MIRLYMMDTNTVSYIVNGRSPAAREKLAALGPTQIACVSSITEAELRFGVAKNHKEGSRQQAALDWFLARLKVLPFARDEAQSYGLLRARLQAAGKMLESMDLLIAAHAIATGSILVTRDGAFSNVADFARIENWATDLS